VFLTCCFSPIGWSVLSVVAIPWCWRFCSSLIVLLDTTGVWCEQYPPHDEIGSVVCNNVLSSVSASSSIVRMYYLGYVVSCLAHPPIEQCYQRNILKLFLYKQSILIERILS